MRKLARALATVLDLDRAQAPAAYVHALVLVHDDQHIAWRADALPGDVDGLLEMLRGARAPGLRFAA